MQETFWILVHIIEELMPREYYTNMLALRADIQLIYKLMAIKDAQLVEHFKQLYIDMSLVVVENFLTIYTNTTYADIVDVIMDHFLDKGAIILLKSMILILGYVREHLLGCQSFCKAILTKPIQSPSSRSSSKMSLCLHKNFTTTSTASTCQTI